MKEIFTKLVPLHIRDHISHTSKEYLTRVEELVDSNRLKLAKSQLRSKDAELQHLRNENKRLRNILKDMIDRIDKENNQMQQHLSSLKSSIGEQ